VGTWHGERDKKSENKGIASTYDCSADKYNESYKHQPRSDLAELPDPGFVRLLGSVELSESSNELRDI
jgi:hypothetical protein